MDSNKRITKNVYKKGQIHFNVGVQKDAYSKLIKLVGGFEKNEKVFDAGCANGILSKCLKDVILIGGDLNVKAGEKIPGYYKISKCDIEKKIPLKNKEVDSVVSISVFQYLDDIDSAFKECIRIAKKRVIINIPNSKFLKLKSLFGQSKMGNVNYLDAKSLEDLGKRHNVGVKIIYLSNKFDYLRKIFGDYLSGGIIGIYKFDS